MLRKSKQRKTIIIMTGKKKIKHEDTRPVNYIGVFCFFKQEQEDDDKEKMEKKNMSFILSANHLLMLQL